MTSITHELNPNSTTERQQVVIATKPSTNLEETGYAMNGKQMPSLVSSGAKLTLDLPTIDIGIPVV